jgi:hypothetical protein
MTTTVTSFASYRNGMPSASARADSRLPFQATRMRSKPIFGHSASGNEAEVSARSEENAFDQPPTSNMKSD